MLSGRFRPWGMLSWMLDRMDAKEWSLFGSISSEERSTSTFEILHKRSELFFVDLLKIMDEPSPFWGNAPETLTSRRIDYFLANGGNADQLSEYKLLEPYEKIMELINAFIGNSNGNIIVDLSSLPKRYYFPFIKICLESDDISNIIATYTVPKSHDNENPLAQDPEPWRDLPTFKPPYPEPEIETIIIGLGYEPLGLPQLLKGEDFRGVKKRLLFPFPATPAGNQKNWEFVRNLDSEVNPYSLEPTRVNAYDVSAVFDLIYTLTDNGNEYSVLAPYGPKPMSLAMCLYACKNSNISSVYYTQPKSYNPYYSKGINTINEIPEVYGYCIRLGNVDFY